MSRRLAVPAALMLLGAIVGSSLAGVLHLWPGDLAQGMTHRMTHRMTQWMTQWIAITLQHLRSWGVAGWAAVALLQVAVAVSGILPASLIGIAARAVDGAGLGFGLAAIGTMLGALLAFLASRSLLRPLIERLLRRRATLLRMDGLIAADGWKFVCLLRISPVMPFAATSYALGLSAIGLRDYMIGTLASLPALLLYVLIGCFAQAGLGAWVHGAAPAEWALLGVGIAATLLIAVRIGTMLRRALTASG